MNGPRDRAGMAAIHLMEEGLLHTRPVKVAGADREPAGQAGGQGGTEEQLQHDFNSIGRRVSFLERRSESPGYGRDAQPLLEVGFDCATLVATTVFTSSAAEDS
jgi:hypothetical protein